MTMTLKITAIQHFDPERTINNELFLNEIRKTIDSWKHKNPKTEEKYTDKEIIKKSEWVKIKSRKYIWESESNMSLVNSCIGKLQEEYWKEILSSIDHIFVSSTSNRNAFPSLATQICQENNLSGNIMALDITNACTWFLNSMTIVHKMSDDIKKVLLVAVDTMSIFKNEASPTTSLLFGDWVASMILEHSDNGSWIQGAKNKTFPLANVSCRTDKDWKTEFLMQGRDVYNWAIKLIPEIIQEYLEEKKISISDFDYIVPHQANGKMIDKIIEILWIEKNKVLYTIEEYWNTASVSIPLTLSVHKSKFEEWDRILMFSIWAGMGISLVDYIR